MLDIHAQVMKDGSIESTSTGTMVSKISGKVTLMEGASLLVKSSINTDGLTVIASEQDKTKTAAANVTYLGSVVTIGTQIYDNATKASTFIFSTSVKNISVYKKVQIQNTDPQADPTYEPKKWTVIVSDLLVEADVKTATLTLSSSDSTDSDTFFSNKDLKAKNVVNENSSIIIDAEKTLNIASDAVLVIGSNSDLVVKGKIAIKGNVTIGGTINVFGEITISDAAMITNYSGNGTAAGKVIVDPGTIEISKYDAHYGVFDAIADLYGAYYVETTINEVKLVICDLDIALDAVDGVDINEVTVAGLNGSLADKDAGAYEIVESFEVSSGVTLNIINGLYIGADYEVTITADGYVNINKEEAVVGSIFVDGKLVDKAMLNNIKEKTFSEVTLENNEAAIRTYTSLKIALEDYTAGDIIKLSGNTTIKSDLTIPADVTVDVNGKTLTVKKGATLTVDGILIGNTIVTEAKDDTTAAGKIIVNNYMITNETYNVTDFNIAGIYGSMTIDNSPANVIVSMPYYILNTEKVNAAEVKGTVEVAEDALLSATEDVTLNIDAGATMNIKGTLTLFHFIIDVEAGATVTGKITAAGNTVEFYKVQGAFTIANVIDDTQETDSLVIDGTLGNTI